METSCVQVYTGDGKGKTTAAVGLAARAAGQGRQVKFVQFLKGRDTGELRALEKIGNIECVRAAGCIKFSHQLSAAELAKMRADAQRVLTRVEGWLGRADVLILDEVMAAIGCGVVGLGEVLRIIGMRGGTELVLTGRDAPEEILERAQLVTRMCAEKHYFDEGLRARKGIEY